MLRSILLLLAGSACLTAAPLAAGEIRIVGLDRDAYARMLKKEQPRQQQPPRPLRLRPLDAKKAAAEKSQRRLSSTPGIRFGFKKGNQSTIGYGRRGGRGRLARNRR